MPTGMDIDYAKLEADLRLTGGVYYADALAALGAESSRLRTALQDILACTPHVAVGKAGYEVVFDCGDPYELARAALKQD